MSSEKQFFFFLSLGLHWHIGREEGALLLVEGKLYPMWRGAAAGGRWHMNSDVIYSFFFVYCALFLDSRFFFFCWGEVG